jgi:thiol-disulfide isomerase/thioredoxin
LCLTGFLNSEPVSASTWLKDLEQAKKLALSTDRLILVDFWASWCGPCKRMDQESWRDPEIQNLMQQYVPLQIDIDSKRKEAMRYGVRSIPYIFIIDGNGEIIYQSLGYMNKNEVAEVLKKYAVNTGFLRGEAVAFYQHENYVTSLRLAEKYLDYSLYLDKEVKPEFIRLAENYLRKGEKMLKKKQKNYKFMKEKVELLELTADLYLENDKAVLTSIEEIEFETTNVNNRGLYAYLNLCLKQKERKPLEVKEWTAILEGAPGGKKYLVQASLFQQAID